MFNSVKEGKARPFAKARTEDGKKAWNATMEGLSSALAKMKTNPPKDDPDVIYQGHDEEKPSDD